MSTIQTAAIATASTVKKTAISLHEVLVDLTKLENPTVAAAVSAFVLKFIPGTGISDTALISAVAAVGVIASAIEKFTSSSKPTVSTGTSNTTPVV